MIVRSILFVAGLTFAATASVAEPAAQSSAPANSGTAASKPADPNEVICEKQEEIGSRLGSKRVCMTRSQWAEQKGQDRQEVEKVQTQRGMYDPH
jgi:invasion protein IalB